MTTQMQPEIWTEEMVANVRRDFPILSEQHPCGKQVVFLDSAASAQKPKAVIDAVNECYSRYFANAYRGVYHFGNRVDEELESTREKVRSLLGAAKAEEIVFTAGTTMSINMVAQSWGRQNLREGDEILLNVLEHHANLVPWQMIAKETGAKLVYVPLTSDGCLDLDQLESLLSPKVKLMAVTGMSNVLGTIPPLEEIVSLCRKNGTRVLVDGAQLVPHAAVDVQKLDIDFLVFSGHKLFGPSGVGVLYGKSELLASMEPVMGGGHMIDQVFQDHSTWAEPPARFEAGTLPIAQIIGLGAAIDYVNELGFDAIHAQEQALLAKAHETLSEIPRLTILGPAIERKGAIVSFTIDGLHPHDIADWLDRTGVAVRAGHHCTMPLHDHLCVHASTRASFAFYNTLEEIDELAEGIRFTMKKHRLID